MAKTKLPKFTPRAHQDSYTWCRQPMVPQPPWWPKGDQPRLLLDELNSPKPFVARCLLGLAKAKWEERDRDLRQIGGTE